jgi:hypothetical protein
MWQFEFARRFLRLSVWLLPRSFRQQRSPMEHSSGHKETNGERRADWLRPCTRGAHSIRSNECVRVPTADREGEKEERKREGKWSVHDIVRHWGNIWQSCIQIIDRGTKCKEARFFSWHNRWHLVPDCSQNTKLSFYYPTRTMVPSSKEGEEASERFRVWYRWKREETKKTECKN